MRIDKVFDIIQGHQITDEELYKTEGAIPVYTGRNELKGHWNQQLITEKDLPCISYPTKGNAGNAYVQCKIFDANNTAVLIPKSEWREKIILEWFVFKLQHIFFHIPTSKEGVSYLNKDIVASFDIEIPDKDLQLRELEYLKKLSGIKENLLKTIDKIDSLLEKSIVYE